MHLHDIVVFVVLHRWWWCYQCVGGGGFGGRRTGRFRGGGENKCSMIRCILQARLGLGADNLPPFMAVYVLDEPHGPFCIQLKPPEVARDALHEVPPQCFGSGPQWCICGRPTPMGGLPCAKGFPCVRACMALCPGCCARVSPWRRVALSGPQRGSQRGTIRVILVSLAE